MKQRAFARSGCIAIAILGLIGCASSPTPRHGLAADVDASCGGPAWRDRYGLTADLTVRRAGHPDLRGVMFYDVRGNRLMLRFPAKSGGVVSCGFDGHTLWIDGFDPEYGDWPTLLQWASWVAVPYRLTEPSLLVRETQPIGVDGATYRVAELQRPSQGSGLCALYIEQDNLRPRGAIPLRQTGIAPDVSGHAFGFAYDELGAYENVLIPIKWSVWPWDPRVGLSPAGPVASITLHSPRFVVPDPDLFEPPRHDSIRASALPDDPR